MDTSMRLILLKIDIGLMNPTNDQIAYLSTLISFAARAIAREGITLAEGVTEDDALVSMYAAWLYRKRAQDPDATTMPRMLRFELNSRLCAQKMAVSGG